MDADSLLGGDAAELRGRRGERDKLNRLIDAVRAGGGQVLVVAGEPGETPPVGPLSPRIC
jgi:hypothetical protein